VKPGLVIGHEPVGVIEELGPGVIDHRQSRWLEEVNRSKRVVVI
jgi:hypothetical protein